MFSPAACRPHKVACVLGMLSAGPAGSRHATLVQVQYHLLSYFPHF